jgi:hypothetical protein
VIAIPSSAAQAVPRAGAHSLTTALDACGERARGIMLLYIHPAQNLGRESA